MGTQASGSNLQRLVLVTEEAEFQEEANIFQADLEGMSAKGKQALVSVLEGIGYCVIHYADPSTFLSKIDAHREDIVLAPWSGAGSANRLSLMPAICEAAGILYVGADASTRAICNDKDLSKLIARKAGFRTAPSLRLIPGDDFSMASELKLPVIIKLNRPGFTGGQLV